MAKNREHPLLRDIPWESSLCFTGHRPEKLPEGRALDGLRETLFYYIRRAVSAGYTHFYTGLADGIDYYAADYLFRLRRDDPRLYVIGIQPCEDYEQFFRRCGYSLPRLRLMQQNVDRLVILPGSVWDKGVFLRRDRMLAECTSGIIAVCRDGRSGSMYTYRCARKLGSAYCRIYPDLPDGSIPEPEQWRVEHSGF